MKPISYIVITGRFFFSLGFEGKNINGERILLGLLRGKRANCK